MFLYLGCGACKQAKTAFFQTAEDISEDLPDTKLAVFNADDHRKYAAKLNVTVSTYLP